MAYALELSIRMENKNRKSEFPELFKQLLLYKLFNLHCLSELRMLMLCVFSDLPEKSTLYQLIFSKMDMIIFLHILVFIDFEVYGSYKVSF